MFLKAIIRCVAILLVLPLLASHFLLSLISSPDRSLESHSQCLSLFPGTTGSYLRVAFYRFALQHCAASATISFGTLFSKVGARIEENVYIGPRCCLGLVTLQRDVLLGPGVQIPSGPQTHGIARLDVPIRSQPGSPQRITIGRDSWIGAASIVLASIADQTIIGAGSIVTKPTGPRVIAVGNPATPLAERKPPTTLNETS